MSNSISRDRERIWKRAQEIGIRRFASDFGVEEPDSALITKAKNSRKITVADGKESGIAEMQYGHEKLAGFSWATFQRERDRGWEGIWNGGR